MLQIAQIGCAMSRKESIEPTLLGCGNKPRLWPSGLMGGGKTGFDRFAQRGDVVLGANQPAQISIMQNGLPLRPKPDEKYGVGSALAQSPEQITQMGGIAADVEVRHAHHHGPTDVERCDVRARHGAVGQDPSAEPMLTKQLGEHARRCLVQRPPPGNT